MSIFFFLLSLFVAVVGRMLESNSRRRGKWFFPFEGMEGGGRDEEEAAL